MIYDTYDLKKALPEGIICIVTEGHWRGDYYVKTGSSTWASIPASMRTSIESTIEYAELMLHDKANSVSPCPVGKLKVWFEEANVNKVLGMVAGTVERADRLQRLINIADNSVHGLIEAMAPVRREVSK